MTISETPQAIAADRARRAAERARVSRAKASQSAATDAAIVAALGAALARVRRGCSIDAFIVDLALEARIRLRTAAISRPASTFRERIGAAPASAGSASGGR